MKISSSLFLAAQGKIACGRQDGSIIIISATKAAITQFLTKDNTNPAGKNLCLRFPGTPSIKGEHIYFTL